MRGFMAKQSWRFVAGATAGMLLGGGALAVAQFPKQSWPSSSRESNDPAAEVAMLLAGLDGGQNDGAQNVGGPVGPAAIRAPEPTETAPTGTGPALAAPALNDAAGAAPAAPMPNVPVDPVAAADKDMAAEVLASGPIHEAFANPTALNPQPGLIVPKKPPENIEELPPVQKPEGKQVEWIPGYWAWDDPRNDFIWVSGIWRDIPPGRRWVPGYWGEAAGGWQWTPGFWAAADQEEIEYQPAPPESLEVGPSSEAPSEGHFWVPGCWVWQDTRYAWRPGYWWVASPDWVWVPHYYSWTPRGYVLCGGFWDWLFPRRGICYSPVYFRRPIYTSVGYYWSPSICFDTGSLYISLFARPNYCHYYFGNYYDPWCARSGFYFWANYHRRRGCYDPIYAHYRWDHVHRRHEHDWERRVTARYEHFVANADARPPRTYAEAVAWRGRGDRLDRDQLEAVRAVRPLDELTKENRLAMKLDRIDDRNRENFRRGGRELQNLAVDRGDIELRRPPRGGRDGDRNNGDGGRNGNRGPDRGDLAGNRGNRGPDARDGNRGDRPGIDRPGSDRTRDNAATGNLRMPRPRDIDAARTRGSAPTTRPDGSTRVDRGPRRPGLGDERPRPDAITSTPDNVIRPDRSERPARPGVARPDIGRPEVSRPEVTRPEVTRPDVARPDVARPRPSTEGRERPSRLSGERPSIDRPRPSPNEGTPAIRERPSRPESRPSIRESTPPSRESRPSARESRSPSVDRSPPRVDRGPSRPGGGESRPRGGDRLGGGDRPSGRSRSEAAPVPRPSSESVARPDLNRARSEAARAAMIDAARARAESRAESRPSPSVARSVPTPRAEARPAPSFARPAPERSAPARVAPRAAPERSFTPAPRPTPQTAPSFQQRSRPSGGPSVRQGPPPGRESGGSEDRRNRRLER